VLDRLDTAMAEGATGGVWVVTRTGQPWISVPKLDKLPEPTNLAALKAEVQRRWGTMTCWSGEPRPPERVRTPWSWCHTRYCPQANPVLLRNRWRNPHAPSGPA
jgi:hypothetical protein